MAARLSTGSTGLDRMLKGGFLERHHVLLAGGPGTGKTLLGLQYLYAGALKGERGVYVSLEEPVDKVLANVRATFPKWDQLDALREKKLLDFVKIERQKFYTLVDLIQAKVTQHRAKRVVIDSSSILELYFENPRDFRNSFFDLLDFLGNLDCTVLILSELPSTERSRVDLTLEMFVVDGVLLLYNLTKDEKRIRAIEVLKMRGTDHVRDLAPIKFSDAGVDVYPDEKVY